MESARLKDNWSCDLLNVNNLISFDRSGRTYKIMNKLSPESLRDKLELRSMHSRFVTRNCHFFRFHDMLTRALDIRLKKYGMISLLIYEKPQLWVALKRQLKSQLLVDERR